MGSQVGRASLLLLHAPPHASLWLHATTHASQLWHATTHASHALLSLEGVH